MTMSWDRGNDDCDCDDIDVVDVSDGDVDVVNNGCIHDNGVDDGDDGVCDDDGGSEVLTAV